MNLKKDTNSLVIVGGGRSVQDGITLGLWDKIKDKTEVWSLNYSYKFIPFNPNKQLWVDTTFFKNNTNEIRDLHHKGIELVTKKAELYNNFPVKQFQTFRSIAEAPKFPDGLFIGTLGLTGTFALSLACKMNYDIIYLLGYDYGSPSLDKKDTHFYQEKVQELGIKSSGVANPRIYLDRDGSVKSSVKDYNYFDNSKSLIYNVSLITNISNFKIISYETMFRMIC